MASWLQLQGFRAPQIAAGAPRVGKSRRSLRGSGASALAALDEVDDQRHSVHPVAGAEPVLDEVGVITRHAGAGVDLDREARRALVDLGHVDQLEAMLAGAPARAHRRLARLDGLGEE